jgi:hypothetical protein
MVQLQICSLSYLSSLLFLILRHRHLICVRLRLSFIYMWYSKVQENGYVRPVDFHAYSILVTRENRPA